MRLLVLCVRCCFRFAHPNLTFHVDRPPPFLPLVKVSFALLSSSRVVMRLVCCVRLQAVLGNKAKLLFAGVLATNYLLYGAQSFTQTNTQVVFAYPAPQVFKIRSRSTCRIKCKISFHHPDRRQWTKSGTVMGELLTQNNCSCKPSTSRCSGLLFPIEDEPSQQVL